MGCENQTKVGGMTIEALLRTEATKFAINYTALDRALAPAQGMEDKTEDAHLCGIVLGRFTTEHILDVPRRGLRRIDRPR